MTIISSAYSLQLLTPHIPSPLWKELAQVRQTSWPQGCILASRFPPLQTGHLAGRPRFLGTADGWREGDEIFVGRPLFFGADDVELV